MSDGPVDIKLITTTKHGRVRVPAKIQTVGGRIEFLKSPFALKDEIKAMKGAKWHGFEERPRKIWSVKDCFRNHFQLQCMMGQNPYEWFDQDLKHDWKYARPLREHQVNLTDFGLTYHYQIWAAEMGVGKGGLPSTKVATPSGWTTLGEIQVGDEVINPDGGRTHVKGVFHRGQMEMYRVTFSDDASVVCSGDHLWNVRTTSRKFRALSYETLELQEIVERGLQYENGNLKHYIPVTTPVEYDLQPLTISPYLLGYILGNGSLSGWTNVISAPDQETVLRLNSMMMQPLQQKKNNELDYHIKDSVVNDFIESTGLKGHLSHSKFLPKGYLHNSVYRRTELLQGLCDSDGYACENGGIEFSTTSPQLAEIFVELTQSLGGTCHRTEKYPTYTYKGEQRTGRLAYRIYASFSSAIVPFKLSRKLDDYVIPTKYEPTRAIVKVESVGQNDCICIAVEAENQLYVTDEFLVTHNTLSAIELMEQSGKKNWWWIGPKKSLDASIKREFNKWNLDASINVEMMSYEMMTKRMKMWSDGFAPPDGVIFDESSRLKSDHAQRTQAAQALADGIRDEYSYGGYVILMSGTPSPKTPVDWWSQAEVAWPGFLREGSPAAFEQRLAHMVLQDFATGSFMKRIGWKDDEYKCADCGEYADAPQHDRALCASAKEYHDFKPGTNEVAYLEERLSGLVVIKHKKDCLDLPDKQYRIVNCEPNATTLRVAKALFEVAPNVITGLTHLRELSDGFQYREKVDGTTKCPVCEDGTTDVWVDPADDEKIFQMIDMLDDEYIETLEKQTVTCPTCKGRQEIPRKVRVTREVPTPKEAALIDLLDENEEQGRIVIFAGFTGSLDRIIKTCHKAGWHTVRCDGSGWRVEDDEGVKVDSKIDPLDYWANLEGNARVAFVAHPQSGGLSMTLTEARMSVFWSNDFNPESRSQAEDRIHRIGMDENKGATIVDLIHLPTDLNIREVLKDNRRLELLTMGEVQNALGISA